MGKHLIYIMIALVIVVVMWSIASVGTKKSSIANREIVTNTNITVDATNITTNVWDYLNSKKNTTVGSSDGEPEVTKPPKDPDLTITIELN